MDWKFDQAPNVVCITCHSIIAGHPILLVAHYEEDHSWCFLDGEPFDMETSYVVAMATVVKLHPEISEIADLPPGWVAERTALNKPWIRRRDV